MYNNSETLQFVEERLRHHDGAFPLSLEFRLRPPRRLTRRYVVALAQAEARTFERVDATFSLRCASGSLWVTLDGDPKDVVLSAGQSYRAHREGGLHLYPLQDCVVEVAFDDDVTEH